MRKILLFVVACCALIGATTATAAPERLYLLGSMTNWEFPAGDGSDYYVLTDEDGDGVYTGEFEFEEYEAPGFFVLTQPVETWDETYVPGVRYGYMEGQTAPNLYGDTDQSLFHYLHSGRDIQFVSVPNWAGGSLKISCKFDTSDPYETLLGINLIAPNQPFSTYVPTFVYVAGSMNNWITPDTDGGPDPIALTNITGTKEYEGEYEFPAGELTFKIIPDRKGWAAALGVSYQADTKLYSNRRFVVNMRGGEMENVQITDWKGGKLKFHFVYDNIDNTGRLILEAPDQPKGAAIPDDVYVIGDHNDWKTPTDSNDNGAIKLKLFDGDYEYSGLVYFGNYDINWEAGNHSYCYCYYDKDTQKWVYRGSQSGYVPAYTLYNYDEEYSQASFDTKVGESGDSKNDVTLFTLKDWEGGNVRFGYFFTRDAVWMYGPDCKARELPDYYVINKTPESMGMVDMSEYGPWAYAWFTDLPYFSMFATTERNYTPSPENIYGAPEEVTVASGSNCMFELVKGGKPINFTFKTLGKAQLSYNWVNSTVYARSFPFEGADFSDAEQLYINGKLTGWMVPSEANREEFEAKYKLKKVAPGIFEGTFDMPADEGDDYPSTQFRFFTDLKGWSRECSVGSNSEDFYCLPVEWDNNKYTGHVVTEGLGNWGLPRWPGGEVRIRVDLNDNTIELVDIQGASIEAVTVSPDDKDATYFNLMGQKVVNPANGLYIRVSKQGVEKVLRH